VWRRRLSTDDASAVEPPAEPTAAAQPGKRILKPDDFDIQDQLGEGAFGQVCLCTLRSTGDKYAVKIIEVIHAKRHGGLQQVKNERDVLILLRHPRRARSSFLRHSCTSPALPPASTCYR
jgi:serine/threonine protein kinase